MWYILFVMKSTCEPIENSMVTQTVSSWFQSCIQLQSFYKIHYFVLLKNSFANSVSFFILWKELKDSVAPAHTEESMISKFYHVSHLKKIDRRKDKQTVFIHVCTLFPRTRHLKIQYLRVGPYTMWRFSSFIKFVSAQVKFRLKQYYFAFRLQLRSFLEYKIQYVLELSSKDECY